MNTQRFSLLLVEDDPINISVISDCLNDCHYDVFIAKTREKALQILQQRDIDIVLLDICLPDGNGFDICTEILGNKLEFGELAIVFMTCMDNPSDEAKGITLGARDYIIKPINRVVLKARIDLQAKLLRHTDLLSALAHIDGATEIPNRRAFDKQIAIEWSRHQRRGRSLALCMFDLDYFKQFNDIYGHPAGDICLKTFAQFLQSEFRRGTDFVARYGGEEFVLIIPDCELNAAIDKVELALTQFLAKKIQHGGSKVSSFVSFSAGVCATKVLANSSITEFLREVDKALYQAKETGRARVVGIEVGKTLTRNYSSSSFSSASS